MIVGQVRLAARSSGLTDEQADIRRNAEAYIAHVDRHTAPVD